LQDYEKQTGIPLANHPLAEQLQNCQSVDAVTTLLQEQTQAFSIFRESDKIMNSLKSVVSTLSRVSAIPTLGQDFGVVYPRPLMVCSTSLTLIYCNSHSHLRMRYILASVSYSLYVPLFRFYVRTLVTSKNLRRSRASVPNWTLSKICSSP
jgi:hypothetical protein